MKENLTIYSAISPTLIKTVLFKGSVIALLGIFILLLAGVFFPLSILQKWGWVPFLVSLGFVRWGLLPYRRLSHLQLEPYKLNVVGLNNLTLYFKGKKILAVPLQAISHMKYVNHPTLYGIAIWLKRAPLPSVTIYQLAESKKLQQIGQKKGKANLFFPYFNQRAYCELMQWQDERNEE